MQGERLGARGRLPLKRRATPGGRRRLLVWRWVVDPDELAFSVAIRPQGPFVAELVRVCGLRWQVEEGFAQTKGEVGLDQDEVRTGLAWHRFVTLGRLLHSHLDVTRLAASRAEAMADQSCASNWARAVFGCSR